MMCGVPVCKDCRNCLRQCDECVSRDAEIQERELGAALEELDQEEDYGRRE